MDLMNNQKNNNNNDLINKRQYNFCVSLISQLIEEIEFETNKNSNQNNNNNKKILFNIFSLLKFQLKLFQELFVVQSRPMYDIVQYQEIQNIFEKGKGFIKKNLKQILSYTKAILEKKSSKTILDNHINLTSSSQNIIGSKNSFNKKLYNTKTFNNYLKNDERKLANENIMTTISKNNEFQNSSNSISSIKISNKNKLKKNLTIMKNKYQNFNIYKKTKKKGIDKNKFHKYYITTENKYSEGNLKKSNSKICINPNSTKNISGQRISVNQIKLSTNDNSKETNKINDSNKDKKNYLTNHLLQNRIIDENPVRKVKNIIINAKSLSSLNIATNQKLNNNKDKEKLKNSYSFSYLNKFKNNNKNHQNDFEETKSYNNTFNNNQNGQKNLNVKKEVSKDRKINEMLIDGMKNIKMKLNSIEKNKKMKKTKSIGDLNYIKNILKIK